VPANLTLATELNIEVMDINNTHHQFVSVHPHAQKRISLFTIELTEECNFRCSYCCFSGKYKERRTHTTKQMSKTTMQQTVDFILKNRCKERLSIVTFYGGEALLALEKMKWIIHTLRTHLGDNVGFSISSNGYILNHITTDWLCTIPNCHIYITIDGFKELHDTNRRSINNKPTYQHIVKNLSYFKERYPKEYEERVHFLTTLERWKDLITVSDIWKNDIFFSDKTPKHLSFVLPKNIEDMQHPKSSLSEKRHVMQTAFERYMMEEKSFLVNQFIEWTDNIAHSHKTYFDNNITTIYTCIEDMYRVFISTEGELYLCERFCSKQSIIGNVKYGLNETSIISLENKFINRRNNRCRNCKIVSICTFCISSLNYTDEEMDVLCKTEYETGILVSDFYWKRRMFDRKRQLMKNT